MAIFRNKCAVRKLVTCQSVAMMAEVFGQRFNKMLLHIWKIHPVLRSFGSSKSRFYTWKIQFQCCCIWFFFIIWRIPQSLSSGIGFNSLYRRFFTATQSKIFKSTLIDGEKSACSTIFRSHVCNCSAVCKRQFNHSRSEKFDKLAYHTVLTKKFHDSQCHVSCSYPLFQWTSKAHSNNIWSKHVNRLTEHDCFGFNTANAPTEHP